MARGNMSENTVIIVNSDFLDSIKRNPRLFVDGVVSRIENQENDPYPGYSRWNGDGVPGVQVLKPVDGSLPSVYVVCKNAGKKLGTLNDRTDSTNPENVLKSLAKLMGYKLVKESNKKVRKKRANRND